MPVDVTLATALLVGLLGSPHCFAMCGGIVGSLALAGEAGRPARQALNLVAYNLGRICSYAAAGFALGWLSRQAFGLLPGASARLAAHALSAAFMIALGLHLGGWWRGLASLERAGAVPWRRIAPLARRLLPVRHPAHAWLLGTLWGWLPCGLVYSALAWSLGSGDPLTAALQMAAFGVGTLPMLLATGGLARTLGRAVRGSLLRQASGLLVLAFGLYSLLALLPVAGGGHRHAAAAATPWKAG